VEASYTSDGEVASAQVGASGFHFNGKLYLHLRHQAPLRSIARW